MIVEILKDSILDNYILGKKRIYSSNTSNDILIQIKEKLELNKNSKIKLVENNIKKPEIPSDWYWIQLNDISYQITDGEHSTPNRISDNHGYYLLSARNILNGKIQLDDVDYVSKEEYDRLSKRCNPRMGDILISCSGSIGRCTLVEDSNNYVMVRSAAMIRPCLVNPKFIMYAIQSPFVRNQIDRLKKQTAQANLFLGAIASIYIPLPQLDEQTLIVNKIEQLFLMLDSVKSTEEKLILLKNNFSVNMKNSILNEAYTGALIGQDSLNWRIDKLINCCNEIATGNSISESVKKSKYTNIELGYNYIATKDLEFNHSFNYENGVKIPFTENKFKFANENDILMCIEGGSAGKKIGILNKKVCYGNKLCKFSTKDIILPKFLYYYLQSPLFLKNFNANLSGIIGGVSINKIKNIEIRYPSIEEQQRIVEKLEQLLPLCDDIDKIVSI